jgi:hypothetical protein
MVLLSVAAAAARSIRIVDHAPLIIDYDYDLC